jgi:hypothetical protein
MLYHILYSIPHFFPHTQRARFFLDPCGPKWPITTSSANNSHSSILHWTEPNPRNPDRPIQVGFIRRGKFYRLFNALLPADDTSHELGVPEYHELLVPSLLDHIDETLLVLIIIARPGSAWKLTRAIIPLGKCDSTL